MKATGIATVFQYVPDPQASIAWYQRLLDVEPKPYLDTQYFAFEAGGAYLMLAPSSPGTGRGGTGVWFEVESVDAAYTEKKADGFVFNEEPFDIPPGRLVTLNDPDGNIIGLLDNSKGGMLGKVPA